MSRLTPREYELLRTVALYQARSDEPPTDEWLCKKLSLKSPGLSNLKKSLRSKGYLNANLTQAALTIDAQRLLEDVGLVLPSRILLRGEVRAGLGSQDVLVRYDEGEPPRVTVFDVESRGNIFALQVVGESMKHHSILEGDYVIVEEFQSYEWPQDYSLIVAKYLAPEDEMYVNLNGEVPDDWLQGPTVKYYLSKKGGYELNWSGEFANPKYTIRTRYLRPIGKVIGVYRSVKISK